MLHAQYNHQRIRGRIANISAGGVYVITNVTLPVRLLARGMDIALRLDGASAAWREATGHVVRIRSGGVALAFGTTDTQLLAVIEELQSASLARSSIAMVLIDAETQRRSAVAAGFRATGCSVVEAATPLEAIVRLGESSFEPDIIAFAGAEDVSEMRAFVEREHPQAKLVKIEDALLQPDGFAHWLSTTPRRR